MRELIDPVKAKNATPIVLEEMNLHEMITLGCIRILKVWGGWIYWGVENGEIVTAVFVPQTSSQQSESQ